MAPNGHLSPLILPGSIMVMSTDIKCLSVDMVSAVR